MVIGYLQSDPHSIASYFFARDLFFVEYYFDSCCVIRHQ